MLFILVTDNATLERVVTVLIDLGIPTTVLESKPLSTVLRTELPIFAALASLLPPTPNGRLLLSITTTALANKAVRLIGAAPNPGRPNVLGSIALTSFVPPG